MKKKWDEIRTREYKDAIFQVLESDVERKRYEIIHKLYEAAGITNTMLMRQAKKRYFTACDIPNTVLYDICYILTEKICSKRNLENMFIDLYSEQYPEIVEKANVAINLLNQGMNESFESYNEFERQISELLNTEKKYVKKNDEDIFCILMSLFLVRSDQAWLTEDITEERINTPTYLEFCSQKRFEENTINYDCVRFTDTDEIIYESSLYKRFFQKTKQRYMSNKIEDTDTIEILKKRYLCFIEEIFIEKNWSMDWFYKILNDISDDEIIDTYCHAVIVEICNQLENEDKPITERRVERYIEKMDLSNDEFVLTCFIIALFISFFQLADAFRKQYYKIFSWDTFTGNNNEQMHEKMYRMYDEQLEKKDRTIESLTNENMLLKEKFRKNEDVVHSEKTKKEKKLEKDLLEKEKEIESLKQKLEMAEQYADIVSRTENVEENITVDSSELQAFKYLFVVEHEEIVSQLRILFPNSIFVSTATTSIKNMKADAIVILTRYISHRLYYKIRNSNIDAPYIYCNGTSINSVLNDIYNGITKP